MNFTITPLSQIFPSLLPALADLHTTTMPTLLADLGQPVVLRYYQLAQNDPSVIGFCALNTENCPLAYCLGSPSPSELNTCLRTPIAWFAAQMLRLALSRPFVLWQLAQSVFSASDENIIQPTQIELTYIGVAAQARGQGLGKAMLTAFADAASSAGYKSVVLSVETDNPAAIALYSKFGFTIIKTFSEGKYHRHRMEYRFE